MNDIRTQRYQDPSIRISAQNGAPAGIISPKQYSEEDIIAVATGKRSLEPKELLTMLSQMISKELPKDIAQLFRGQKFSMVAEQLSARLNVPRVALADPREVMAALLIGSKNLSTLSIKALYTAGQEFSMSLSDTCDLLMTLRQGDKPVDLERLGIALEYKKENPERTLDKDRLLAYVEDTQKVLQGRSVGDVIESALEEESAQDEVNPDEYARLRIFVYDAKIPKLNFGHGTVHEVMEQVYEGTAELNKKIVEMRGQEKRVADMRRDMKVIEKAADEKIADGITMLKKTSAYIGLQNDTPAMHMKKQDIRMQALQEKQRKELLRTSLGGVAMVV